MRAIPMGRPAAVRKKCPTIGAPSESLEPQLGWRPRAWYHRSSAVFGNEKVYQHTLFLRNNWIKPNLLLCRIHFPTKKLCAVNNLGHARSGGHGTTTESNAGTATHHSTGSRDSAQNNTQNMFSCLVGHYPKICLNITTFKRRGGGLIRYVYIFIFRKFSATCYRFCFYYVSNYYERSAIHTFILDYTHRDLRT